MGFTWDSYPASTRNPKGSRWDQTPEEWIAVAYQNLTARHRLPKPRGKDRRYRIHFWPDEAEVHDA